jgi:hypothetical protein
MRASERDPHGPAIADFFQRAELLPVIKGDLFSEEKG